MVSSEPVKSSECASAAESLDWGENEMCAEEREVDSSSAEEEEECMAGWGALCAALCAGGALGWW